MKKVGVIFLSLGANAELQSMTQKAIDSCLDGASDIEYRVVVYESVVGVDYENAFTLYPLDNEPFNYNRCMNLCRNIPLMDDCDYFALCNNDLVFEKGWASNLIEKMIENDVLSACPMDPTIHSNVQFENGVNVGRLVTRDERQLAGWCIFQDRKIYDIIERLDEEPLFWHSDTHYSLQLANNAIKHILVEDSVVHHLNCKTISSDAISQSMRDIYTVESKANRKIYNKGEIQ